MLFCYHSNKVSKLISIRNLMSLLLCIIIIITYRLNGYDNSIKTYGMVSGMINSCCSLGALIAPTLSGALAQHFGFAWSCTAAAGIMALMVSQNICRMGNKAQVLKLPHNMLICSFKRYQASDSVRLQHDTRMYHAV
jgi:MFS family permease